MRVSKQAAAENRQRIVQQAARLFRERGFSAVGVDSLAGAAGLSSGGLYSHFGSKDGLTAEAVEEAFASFAAAMSGNRDFAEYVAAYLSPAHRDDRGAGCPVATLASEIPRQSKAVRASFTARLKLAIARMTARLRPGQDGEASEAAAWMTAATLLGTMVLARVVDDEALSDRILAMGRAEVLGRNG